MDSYGCSSEVTLGLWQAESRREAGEDAQGNAAEEWHAGSGGCLSDVSTGLWDRLVPKKVQP